MWRSKMQKTTALPTAEAAYYSASSAGVGVLRLRNLLEQRGVAQGNPTPVLADTTACIEWGNIVHSVMGGRERAKHTDIRKHFAHEVIQNGKTRLVRVATAYQLADILSKGLRHPQWKACGEGILGKSVHPTIPT